EIPSVINVAGSSHAQFIMLAAASFVVGITLTGAFLLMRSGAERAPAVQPADAPGVHPSVASHSPAKVAEERSQPLLAAVPAAGTIAASGPPDGVEVVGEPEMDTAADPAESPPDPDTTVSGPPTNESPA